MYLHPFLSLALFIISVIDLTPSQFANKNVHLLMLPVPDKVPITALSKLMKETDNQQLAYGYPSIM
jgi:hypothetical protein